MKIPIFDAKKHEVGKASMPVQFSEPVRADVIQRAVEVLDSNARQPYGADPMAGKKCSAKLSRRRHDYRASYGFGISRVPRKILSRRGTRMTWVGAFAPGTVGGRKAHPPKAEKNRSKSINTKERRMAIRSAMAATVQKDLVASLGFVVPNEYPFIIDSKIENVGKTKELVEAMSAFGLDGELDRSAQKKVRAGRGKMRGRRYKRKQGLLIVVAKDCELLRAAANVPGVEARIVDSLNAKILTSGAKPGRLTLWTQSAIERIDKEKLFL